MWRASYAGLVVLPVVLAVACSDAGRTPFEAAAAQDRGGQQSAAVDLYLEAHAKSAESHYGKLAFERARVLLLEIGAQQLQESQWDDLDATAGKLLELEPESMAGYTFKAYAAYGKGRYDEAEQLLSKAAGDARGVAPPSDLAVEATAKALFRGAEAGARSSLGGSVVDAAFLTGKRDRLLPRIKRDREGQARRRELLQAATEESMATLIDNYADSEEAKQIKPRYAELLSKRLASVESVGEPTVEDPDPISTVTDSLAIRVPDEPLAREAIARAEKLRPVWEERHAEKIKEIDEAVQERIDQAVEKISAIIRDKCAPIRGQLSKGEGSPEDLIKARDEAVALVPNGMSEEELNEIGLLIAANCTPPPQ